MVPSHGPASGILTKLDTNKGGRGKGKNVKIQQAMTLPKKGQQASESKNKDLKATPELWERATADHHCVKFKLT